MSNQLSEIKFYEVARKRPKGEKKKSWLRRTHADKVFEQKATVIKMIAQAIDKKLVNY